MSNDIYTEAGAALMAAVRAELGPWIVRLVLERAPDRADEAAAAAHDATAQVVERLRVLLATDIDEQRGTPLQIVRNALRFPTAVLRDAGVAPARRDEWAVRADPDDDYDLMPATWADLGPASGEAGLVWGAAKAMVHLARHRPPPD